MALELKDLIRRTREELLELEAERTARGNEPLFRVDSIVVEASFIVEESNTSKGGFDLKLISAGAEAAYGKNEIHKVAVTLTAPTAPSLISRNVWLYNPPPEGAGPTTG